LDCTGYGVVSNILAGINWITANRINPAVANMSLTLNGVSSSMNIAIENAVSSGVTFVVAAGNSNRDACLSSPASATNAITVGATSNFDSKAGYSNFGSCVDVFAPGNYITSLSHVSDTDTRVMSGTSMASPMVAGAAALYLQSHPVASPATVTSRITSDSTKGLLTELDGLSPNMLLYSWLGEAAPPTPAAVTIVKQVQTLNGGTSSSTSFQYSATNLASSNFTLVDNDSQPADRYVDIGVTQFSAQNTITVTESQVAGWQTTSINCVETGTNGLTSIQNTTADLTSRSANIIVEEGESVTCTFLSQEISPTSAPASISGRVTTDTGRAIKGASVYLYDSMEGRTRTSLTNSFGYYSFQDVPIGQFYTMGVNRTKQYVFSGSTRSFTLNADLTDVNFVGKRK
jgi:hypothetical protein